MNHTPGPWKVKTYKGEPLRPTTFEVHNHAGLLICSVNIGMSDVVTNSNLIAAAPELLEALEDLIRIVKPGDKSGWYNSEWIKAEKAIKKSKGL